MYLTFGELASSTGIIKSQVLDMLKSMSCNSQVNMHLFMVSPCLNKKSLMAKISKVNEVKNELKNSNIRFRKLDLFAPGKFFHSINTKYKIFHFFKRQKLIKYVEQNKISIIHCRSYHAAIEAIRVKQSISHDVKVLFDPRGLLPEEVLIKTGQKEAFQFYKAIERDILKKTDMLSAVSDGMAEHFSKLFNGPIKINYACFSASPNISIPIIKSERNYKTLCYIGNISENGYHSTHALSLLYKSFKETFKETRLLLVTQSNVENIGQVLKISNKEIETRKANSSQEVFKIISENADFGALPFTLTSDSKKELVASTMIGNKTIEYLFAGVKPIINYKCSSAIALVKKHYSGYVFNPNDNFLEAIGNKEVANLNDLQDLFDTRNVATKYIEIYKELLK